MSVVLYIVAYFFFFVNILDLVLLSEGADQLQLRFRKKGEAGFYANPMTNPDGALKKLLLHTPVIAIIGSCNQ